MMIDEKLDPAVAKEIVRGEQDKLNSAFYLGYNMILNLMRVEGISPEFMLERCFFQFQNTASVSGLEKQLADLEAERASITIDDEQTVKDYYDLRSQLNSYAKDMRNVVNHPQHSLQFLQSGRLVKVKHGDHDFGWGAVVNFVRRARPKGQASDDDPDQNSYIVDVLLQIASDAYVPPKDKVGDDLPPGVRPPATGEKGKMEVVPVILSTIDSIGHIRIFLPNDLRSAEQRNTVRKGLDEVKRRFPDGIAILDPVENMGITDESFKKLLRVCDHASGWLEEQVLTHE